MRRWGFFPPRKTNIVSETTHRYINSPLDPKRHRAEASAYSNNLHADTFFWHAGKYQNPYLIINSRTQTILRSILL